MNYRVLGSTGLRVSEVGMGGIGAMGKYGAVSAQEFSRTMARAEQTGMNFLDTAPSYGDSEAVFGYHLKDHRDLWIVCTKVGRCGSGERGVEPPTAEQVKQQLVGSLRRLRVEHVDVALIHSIDQYAGDGANLVDRISGPNGPLDALKKLQEQGLARFIGISGQLPALLEAAASNLFQVLLTYNTFNLLVRQAQERLFPLAQELDIGVVLGGAFYQGLLSGQEELVLANVARWFERQDPGFSHTDALMAKVRRLRQHVGHDPRALRSVALRYALSHPAVSVVVSGMKEASEVEENANAAAQGPLSAEEQAELEALVDE